MACPPAGPWAAPRWAMGQGSLCWSLCPPEEEVTALRPRSFSHRPWDAPHACHFAFVPQTQLGASWAPTLPSQDSTPGPSAGPYSSRTLWLGLVGAYSVPKQAPVTAEVSEAPWPARHTPKATHILSKPHQGLHCPSQELLMFYWNYGGNRHISLLKPADQVFFSF